ncbi:MAG: XRE family transcriptional regulator [Planctomycetota bacterium]|nr:XRE family transcriptional regulator [Planctomycetota bacterium]
MKRSRPVVTHTVAELVAALGLPHEDAVEFEVRLRLSKKIIEAVAESGLTQQQVATAARTSRTRLTALLNGNTQHISTDLMLRILAALGYSADIRFRRVKPAA